MKTNIFLFTLIIAFTSLSCKKDKILDNNPENLSETVKNGKWEITYFFDSDKDETSHFSSFEFAFEESGILKADNGTRTYTGSWSAGNDDSTTKLNISFSSPDNFKDLTDDWHVKEFTAVEIKLEDVSGGDGSIDYLTFKKI